MRPIDRLLRFIKHIGASNYAVEKQAGLGNGYISKQKNGNGTMGSDAIEKILNAYPTVDVTWLVTGKGAMIKEELTGASTTVEDVTGVYTPSKRDVMNDDKTGRTQAQLQAQPQAQKSDSGFPLVSVEAVAGFGSSDFAIQQRDVQGYYTIPYLLDVSFLVPVRGESMMPKYNPGDMLACRILNNQTFIQWGKVHVIATKEQGVIVKRLNPGALDGHYLAVSDNPQYKPFELPLNEITGIALVLGAVTLEA